MGRLVAGPITGRMDGQLDRWLLPGFPPLHHHSTPFLTSKAPSPTDGPCQGPSECWASLVSSLVTRQLQAGQAVGLCDGRDSGPGRRLGHLPHWPAAAPPAHGWSELMSALQSRRELRCTSSEAAKKGVGC